MQGTGAVFAKAIYDSGQVYLYTFTSVGAFASHLQGQDYLIESISSNEAFGQIYLYRLLLREARQQAV